VSKQVLWSGRFNRIASDRTLAYTSSISVDRRLAWYDVVGSMAHAQMLGRQGILPQVDVDKIVKGLRSILKQIEQGQLTFSEKLEDVHTNIEFLLTESIGEAGARLHTARSRNDQVATDLRMYLRDATLEAVELVGAMQLTLIKRAKENLETVMPGFTHMQHAQPVSLAHHLMAHEARLQRDASRFLDSYQRLNLCPLGAAALAGTTYPIDRHHTAKALGFAAPTSNSMDSVSDRDFAAELLFCCASTMTHLSSMSEELMIWSSPEFGFAEVSDAYATGSSIMPQKKNPDVAELMRGRSARVIGDLGSMLVLLKGLPLTYNRDLQEDKALTFSTLDVLLPSLEIAEAMFSMVEFDQERMLTACERGYLNATELADYLVIKGIPFRTAHEITGRVVRKAMDQGKRLEEMSLAEMRKFSDHIEEDIYRVLPLRSCVDRRCSYGGTSPVAVRRQIERAEDEVIATRAKARKEKRRLLRAYSRLLTKE